MIKIIGDITAIENNMGYTVAHDRGKLDKDGKPLYDTIGYVGDLSGALWLAAREYNHNKLNTKTYTLKEAIDVLKETKQLIDNALKGLE